MPLIPTQFDGETSRLVLLVKRASFSNGLATIDLTSELSAIGFSTIGEVIMAQVQAGAATSNVLRGCSRGSDNKSVKIYANSSSYSDSINCNILINAIK